MHRESYASTEAILAKPGRLWTADEKRLVLDCVLRLDTCDFKLCLLSLRRYRCISREDAADILQSFLALHIDRVLARYDPQLGTLKRYLQACLVQHCRDQARALEKKRRAEEGLLPTDAPDLAEIPDDSFEGNPVRRLDQRELRQKMREAIAKLPFQYRQVLLIFIRDAKSYQEIADELGVSIAIVRNRLHRAREQLRATLKDR